MNKPSTPEFSYRKTKEKIDLLVTECLNFFSLLDSISLEDSEDDIRRKFDDFSNKLTDSQLRHLYENLFESLLTKHQEVNNIRSNEDELFTQLESFGLRKEDVKIVFRPFSVNIILSPSLFDNIFIAERGSKIMGVHYRGSCLNFIRGNEDDPEIINEIIHHEDLHNILDGINYFQDKSLEEAAWTINFITKLHGDEKTLSRKEILTYLDALHEEFLAASWSIENLSELLSEYQLPQWFTSRDMLETSQFGLAALIAETAGSKISLLTKNMEDLGFPKSQIDYLKNKFLEIIFSAEKGLVLGKKLGPDVYRHILGLLVVLPPTSWSTFIDDYLVKKFGKEKIQEMYERFLLIHRFNGSLSSLRKINELTLEEEEKAILLRRFESIVNIRAEVKSLEDLEEYEKLLIQIAEKVSLSEQIVDEVMKRVIGQYFINGLLR
ncbi:MAG: hypothetical protein NZ822_01415 [Patescibacteria group bacterium]|nr:hypothetical protein [Patescibacteria group bacterium]